MNRPPFARTLVAVALAGSATLALAQQAAPPAPPATPRAAVEVDIERLTRDAERVAREYADRAASFRWNMLAEAGDFDLDTDGPSFAFIAREFGSAREIVKNAPYTAEAVNEVVQTLEAQKLVTRRPDPSHGRIVQLKLTARGTETLRKCDAAVRALEKVMLAGFSDEAREALRSSLVNCVKALEQRDGSASSQGSRAPRTAPAPSPAR